MLVASPSAVFIANHKTELLRITDLSRVVERNSAALIALRPELRVIRPVAFATQAWRTVIDITPRVDDLHLGHLRMTARGTAGAVEAGILLSEPVNAAVERVRAENSAARGPIEASTDLRLRLVQVHPDLQNRLDGAWERINNGGADAASQAANSLMEVVDWTLRLLAPDNEVLEWHTAQARSETELHQGKPTRTVRIRYVARDHPEKLRAVELYVKSIQELVKVIQSPKHAVETRAVEALGPIALTVEGLLYFLVAE
jgi:Predicted pPIWI-associating nuclease